MSYAERPETPPLPDDPDVFISYRRSERSLIDPLLKELRADLDLWIDVEDIPKTTDWRQKIEQGIASSSAFVFILSDASLASPECIQELAIALRFGKRLIPVQIQDLNAEVPDDLGRLNWIVATNRDPSETATEIEKAIATDLDWVEFHTRLLQRAHEWDGENRETGLLLSGAALTEAQVGIDTTGGNQSVDPVVAQIQREYVAESAARQRRRRTYAVAVGIALALIAIAAGVATFQWFRAEDNKREAEALRLSSDGALLVNNQLDLGLLLTLEGASIDNNQSVHSALVRGLSAGPGLRSWSEISSAEIDSAKFSDDGETAVFQNTDDTISWISRGDMEPRTADVNGVSAVSISGDGRKIVAATTGGIVVVDTHTAELVAPCPVEGTPTSIGMNLEGSQAAVGIIGVDDVPVVLVINDGCTTVSTLNVSSTSIDLDYSADGDTLATVAALGGIELWQPSSGLPYPPLPDVTDRVFRSVAFSPTTDMMAAGTENGVIVLWDYRTAEQMGTMPRAHDGWVTSLAFGLSGSLLTSGGLGGSLRAWNVSTTLPDAPTLISYGVDRNPAAIFATASSGTGDAAVSIHSDGRFVSWDLVDRSPLSTPVSAQPGVRGLVIGGRQLLAAGLQGVQEILPEGTLEDGYLIDNPVTAIATTRDGEVTIAGTRSGQLRVIASKPGLADVLPPHDDMVNSLALSVDGSTLLSGSDDGTIRITDMASGVQSTLVHGGGYVSEVAFALDDTLALSAGEDFTIQVWSITTEERLRTFTQHGATVDALAVHPDGVTIASGSDDRSILIWNVVDEGEATKFSGHTDRVLSLAFSDDGTRLASSSEDAAVIVWNTEDGSVVGQPLRNELNDQPQAVVFFPEDSGRVYAGGSGVLLWDLRPDAVQAVACSIVSNRELSLSEADRYLQGSAGTDPCG